MVTLSLTGALLVVHGLSRVFSRVAVPPLHPAGWCLLPFLVYAAANVIWVTPVPWLGRLDWLGWAQLAAVFWVVLNGVRSAGPRRALFIVLVLLGLVGVAFACYQRFVQPDWLMLGRVGPADTQGRASGPFGLPNSFAGYVLLLLPAMGALAFRSGAAATERVWWGWVAVVLAFGLLLTVSRGGLLALAVALVAWPLWSARGNWGRRARIAGLMFGAVAFVGGMVFWQSPKVRSRATVLVLEAGERTRPIMWRAAWELFRAAPMFGAGAGSYNVVFERHRPERFADEPLWAHNEYLNTLSDYGAVGVGLLFGAVLVVIVQSRRRQRENVPRTGNWLDSPLVISGVGVGLGAFGLQMGLEFHLKIPALALSVATMAGLAGGSRWPCAGALDQGNKRALATMSGWAAIIGSVGLLLWSVPLLRAEGFRQSGRRIVDALAQISQDSPVFERDVARAISALQRATQLDARNAQAWSDLAYATALRGNLEPARRVEFGRDAEAAAERALCESKISSEFWIRRGIARDIQGRWEDAGPDFQHAVRLAPTNAYAWFHYAEHLYRFNGARGAGLAALETCLRLDPGNAPGLALRQRLAIELKPN